MPYTTPEEPQYGEEFGAQEPFTPMPVIEGGGEWRETDYDFETTQE